MYNLSVQITKKELKRHERIHRSEYIKINKMQQMCEECYDNLTGTFEIPVSVMDNNELI